MADEHEWGAFEAIDDGDRSQGDISGELVKHGNAADRLDMARMGKIQQMRVRTISIRRATSQQRT